MKAIIHAKVVFPDRIVEDGGILIENGRIAASGRIDIPDGAAVIDAKGLYALDSELGGRTYSAPSLTL